MRIQTTFNPSAVQETKNNHGNFSDVVALALIAVSLAMFFKPDHLYMDLGPLKATGCGG